MKSSFHAPPLNSGNTKDTGLGATANFTGRGSGLGGGTGTMLASSPDIGEMLAEANGGVTDGVDTYDRHIIGNAGVPPVDQGHATAP